MDTATKHKNKLLLLGVLVALVSMVVSTDAFQLQNSGADFFEAIATRWDMSLNPGKLIYGGVELKALLSIWK